MKITVIRLDENLEEKKEEYDLNELEVDKEGIEPPTGMAAMADDCMVKTLVSLDLPDGVDCSIRRGCRVRMRRHRLFAQVCYPPDTEQALTDALRSCFETGVRAAIAAVGLSVVITPGALSAAVPVALSAFEVAFIACMGDKMSEAIKFNIAYENHRV